LLLIAKRLHRPTTIQ